MISRENIRLFAWVSVSVFFCMWLFVIMIYTVSIDQHLAQLSIKYYDLIRMEIREIYYEDIKEDLTQMNSDLIQTETGLKQVKSDLIQTETGLTQMKSNLIQMNDFLYNHKHRYFDKKPVSTISPLKPVSNIF